MLRSVAAILPLLAGAERAAAEATHAPPLLVLQDYGIYETRVGGYGPAPGNSSGVLDVIEEEHLVRQTHEVCAMLGTSFGIRFGIAGARPFAAMPVEVVLLHPALTNRSGKAQLVDTIETSVEPGHLHFSGWTFHDPRNLVAGEWRMLVHAGGRIVIDVAFHLRTDCAPLIS